MNEAGLTPKPKPHTEPIHRKMVQIGKSSLGKAATEASAAKGEPAPCGFVRLLQSYLGEDLSETRCPGTTMSAGRVFAGITPKLDYVRAERGTCSDDCGAREGIVWIKV